MKNYIIKHNNGNDLFDGFDGFFRPFYPVSKDLMRTDVRETETEYVFDVEVPGFKKEDISVTYDDGYVSVTAKREENEEEKDNFLRRERNCSCERSFYVGEIEKTMIKAKYENGVLTLTIPKEAPKKPESHIIAID